MSNDVPIIRLPLSMPCNVPVSPGTPDIDAPVEERTERCAVDAFWLIGRAAICDLHLRGVLGGDYAELVGDVELHAVERVPWSEMRRAEQRLATPLWAQS